MNVFQHVASRRCSVALYGATKNEGKLKRNPVEIPLNANLPMDRASDIANLYIIKF